MEQKRTKTDVFISHATEDKLVLVEPLSRALINAGLTVWLDQSKLGVGDSIKESIEEGLANSRFAIVVLSPSYFAKHWTRWELNALMQKEAEGQRIILPVWYNLTKKEVQDYSPLLVDRYAAIWEKGLDSVVAEIVQQVRSELPVVRGSFKPGPESKTVIISSNAKAAVIFDEKDERMALELKEVLKQHNIEIPSVPFGSDVLKETARHIKECDHLLVILSDAAQSSERVARSLGLALNLRRQRKAPRPRIPDEAPSLLAEGLPDGRAAEEPSRFFCSSVFQLR